MSLPTRLTSKTVATLWQTTEKDRFGVSGFAAPVLIMVTIDTSEKYKYSNIGINNIPNYVIYMEHTIDIKKGDYISKGDHTLQVNPIKVIGSNIVTEVDIQDCSLLRQIDDIRVVL